MFGGEPSDKSHLMSKIDEDSNSPRNIQIPHSQLKQNVLGKIRDKFLDGFHCPITNLTQYQKSQTLIFGKIHEDAAKENQDSEESEDEPFKQSKTVNFSKYSFFNIQPA